VTHEPVYVSFRRDFAGAFMRNGERSVAEPCRAVVLERASGVMRRRIFARKLAPRQRVLQILVKCRLFEICEKTRLIHLEYRQKARGAENQRFKPCC